MSEYNYQHPKFNVGEIVTFNDNSLCSKQDYIYLGYPTTQPVVMSMKTHDLLFTIDEYLVSSGKRFDVVPTEVIKREIEAIAFADQCDQASAYELRLKNALKLILEWRNTPAYQCRLEQTFRLGKELR